MEFDGNAWYMDAFKRKEWCLALCSNKFSSKFRFHGICTWAQSSHNESHELCPSSPWSQYDYNCSHCAALHDALWRPLSQRFACSESVEVPTLSSDLITPCIRFSLNNAAWLQWLAVDDCSVVVTPWGLRSIAFRRNDFAHKAHELHSRRETFSSNFLRFFFEFPSWKFRLEIEVRLSLQEAHLFSWFGWTQIAVSNSVSWPPGWPKTRESSERFGCSVFLDDSLNALKIQ